METLSDLPPIDEEIEPDRRRINHPGPPPIVLPTSDDPVVDILWAYNNLAIHRPKKADAPTIGAWAWALWSRKNPDYFLTKAVTWARKELEHRQAKKQVLTDVVEEADLYGRLTVEELKAEQKKLAKLADEILGLECEHQICLRCRGEIGVDRVAGGEVETATAQAIGEIEPGMGVS